MLATPSAFTLAVLDTPALPVGLLLVLVARAV
jgi:hypothetical protein